MANITYFLGAGASFYAMPVQMELPEKMIQLAELFLPEDEIDFESVPKGPEDFKKVLKYIGYWGNEAKKNHSIDSYTKTIWRNNGRCETSEIDFIKITLSYFFTLWMKCTNQHWKGNRSYERIDHRILYLVNRAIDDQTNRLKTNIKFVTWNYDLQIEAAFIQNVGGAEWRNINEYLRVFEDQVNDDESIDVCHLNGTHGYITTPKGVFSQIRGTDTEIPEYIYDDGGVSLDDYFRKQVYTRIGFAWDNDELSKKRREAASKIFSNTDHLVVIGYSFPDFNRDVDAMLFKQLPKKARITVYSKGLPREFFKTLAQQVKRKNIEVINDHPEEYPIPSH